MNRMQELLYPGDPAEVQPRQTLKTGTPEIHLISAPDDLLQWLNDGWRDLWRAPSALLHGLLVSAVGAILVWATWARPSLSIALIFGFLLVGPILAMGVNDLARRLERGESTTFRTGLGAVREVGGGAWIFAAILITLFALWASFIWLWIGVMNVGILEGPVAPTTMLGSMLATPQGVISLIGAFAAWITFALVVFGISLVTLPALLDRRRGLVDAIGTSLRALNSNLPAMLLWGVIITGLFAISAATAFLALIVIFPWLGFAMWRGYRAMVTHDGGPAVRDDARLVDG